MPEPGYEPLCTAAEMRAAEEAYPGYPDTVPELMERAGAGVAYEAMRVFPYARRFAVVCGGGSNGGDGRVAARVLRDAGREAVETDAVEGADVVVDALFGTGFHGTPRPEAAALIERINGCGAPVVSVDVPSGVDASTGEVAGAAVDAALTVTFHASKVGLHVAPGPLPRRATSPSSTSGSSPSRRRSGAPTPALLRQVPRRGARDSKFTAGSVLVVGGAPGTTGAPVLTALAALRADAGYVDARRAAGVPARRRDARARAGQARLRLGRRRGADPGRGGSGRTPSRSAPASVAAPRRTRSWRRCSSGSSCRSSSMPTRSSASSRSRARTRRC